MTDDLTATITRLRERLARIDGMLPWSAGEHFHIDGGIRWMVHADDGSAVADCGPYVPLLDPRDDPFAPLIAEAVNAMPAILAALASAAERAERAEAERYEAVERRDRATDWYQQRFNRLRRWVNEEVRPLSADVATRYFAICANGSPAPHESADWTNTMHALRLERDAALAKLARVEAVIDASGAYATLLEFATALRAALSVPPTDDAKPGSR